MKIVYTKHAALEKFSWLRRHKFIVAKHTIKKIIIHPDNIDEIADYPKIIASKSIDSSHILRVVYRREGDIIKVITFYPARKGRYYEN